MNDPAALRAKFRADFMQRLFAIAISIGIATTLVRMDWIIQGRWPDLPEWEELCILLTGIVLTVSSWDGYLLSIAAKPLRNWLRFAIDIFLVLTYLFFLLTAVHKNFFLTTVMVIFWVYVLWDIVSFLERRRSYLVPSGAVAADLYRVYWKGARDAPKVKRGPIITLVWAGYFTVLWTQSIPMNHAQLFANCIFCVAGLVAYRLDKDRPATDLPLAGQKGGAGWVTGFQMFDRVLLASFLICCACYV